MKEFKVKQIGEANINSDGMFIKLQPEFIPALKALEGFGYINVFWWFDKCDNDKSRNVLEVSSPYKHSPELMGTFATRSPERPNPIALTVSEIINIDYKNGLIQISYTDADNKTPVIDLKPYTPSLDRIENPDVPEWCSHWPKSVEESGDFNWENEFNF